MCTIMKECESKPCIIENKIANYVESQFEMDGVAWIHLYREDVKGKN